MRLSNALHAIVLSCACLSLPLEAVADSTNAADLRDRLDSYRVAQAFDCRDVSCKKLSSCAEACYKLVQCGQSKRDGDHDGIPCENLCSRRC